MLLKIAQKTLTAPSWNFPVLSMPNKGWFGLTVVSATAGCIVFKLGTTAYSIKLISFLQYYLFHFSDSLNILGSEVPIVRTLSRFID